MNTIRDGLPPLPQHMAGLPISDKGYPVPWFVQWIDGKPDFRVMDGAKLVKAVRHRRCWVCGGTLGRSMTFAVGPMCIVNRTSAEPPSHYACAKFSAAACPFLTLPKAVRREANMPDNLVELAGVMIPRNPGVTCLWTVRDYKIYNTATGPLFKIGDPDSVEWYAEKQIATREQIMASIDSGLTILRGMAESEGPPAIAELERLTDIAMLYVPVPA